MPDTLFISNGVSLGLLAGVVSGVCYLIANGLAWSRNDRGQRCLKEDGGGVCRRCGGDTRGGAIPCICLHHKPVKFETGAWFLRQVQKTISLMPWSFSTEKLEQIDEETEAPESPDREPRELHNVREFLEALSAKLAGGPLEGIRVAPLYDHPAYVRIFDRHHPPLRATLSALGTALRDALTRKTHAHVNA